MSGWGGGGGVRVQLLLTLISRVRYRLGSDVSTFQMLQPYIRYPGYEKTKTHDSFEEFLQRERIHLAVIFLFFVLSEIHYKRGVLCPQSHLSQKNM